MVSVMDVEVASIGERLEGIEGGAEEVTIFSFSGLRDAEIGLRLNVQSEKGDFSGRGGTAGFVEP